MEQYEKDQLLNQAAQSLVLEPPDDLEEAAIVDGLAQAELQGRINQSSEIYNLASGMEPDLLREIGQEVWKGFDSDDQSRTDWLKDHEFWLALYMQKDQAMTQDPERSWGSTESVPILMEACDMFQARTYKIFFPNDNFVSAAPVRRSKDPEKNKVLDDRSQRIGRHMSYQLGIQDKSYRQDKDALFLGTALHGSFFTKTYFSEKKKRFCVDNVRPTDFVVNYTVGPARLEDLKRKSHIIYTTIGDTARLAGTGYFIEEAKPARATIDNTSYNIKVDEIQGISPGDTALKQDEQAVLIEQHVYMDWDGVYKPYIITICAASKRVLRIVIGYEADPQGNPLKDFEQTEYFTHYKYKENPNGFYGLGLGHSIGDLNSSVNIMLRQTMDAAMLANEGNMSGFISERLGLEGDEIRLSIGKFRKIPDTVGDLQNSLWTGQFPGPNSALMTLMEQLDLRAQRLGATTEGTTGTVDKVVQPTTLITQIEQALEQFSSVQMRLAHSLSEELQKIYKINQKFLPLVDYFVVNDEPEAITRADYADDMMIAPVFDPKYATQGQKIARSKAELEATLQNPVNQSRPQVIDAAFRRYFEALQVEDIDELVPPQPEVQRIDDQYIENMYYIMPPESRPVFDVFPEQDHADHLQKIQELYDLAAQMGMELLPEQQEALLKHQLKHYGYLYGQITGVIPAGQVSPNAPDGRSDISLPNENVTGTLSAPQAQLLNAIMGGAAPNGGPAGGNGVFTEGTG